MAYQCSESLSRVYISPENLLPVAILKSLMHYITGSDAAVLGPRAGDDLQVLKILVTARSMFLNIAFLEVLSGPTLNHCVSF
ncbi:hypothetical protein PILCRDRAFT_829715 [Piloderma croceum F 1598]|uniref:Uncharacterized protein n=1 Tax=Piloderma croceum (strain F 1598) TaxID=765440 RepID=A0A0C3AF91_PILCF|nr:hypothetical protein PILCRDRAFT_829715 [Piloderma croceum F 1598]